MRIAPVELVPDFIVGASCARDLSSDVASKTRFSVDFLFLVGASCARDVMRIAPVELVPDFIVGASCARDRSSDVASAARSYRI